MKKETVVGKKKSMGKEAKEWAIAIGVCLMVTSLPVLAQSTDELGGGICKLVGILTGKWLFGFAILATAGAGSALLFGAEMSDGIKKLATIISIIGLILSMGSILSFAFTKFSSQSCS